MERRVLHSKSFVLWASQMKMVCSSGLDLKHIDLTKSIVEAFGHAHTSDRMVHSSTGQATKTWYG